MRATAFLRQQWNLRLTLFIRQNCSLCTDAKDVMSKVWDRRPFEYTEIDVMAAKQEKWKNLYEFDTPVVSVKVVFLNVFMADKEHPGACGQSTREQPALRDDPSGRQTDAPLQRATAREAHGRGDHEEARLVLSMIHSLRAITVFHSPESIHAPHLSSSSARQLKRSLMRGTP